MAKRVEGYWAVAYYASTIALTASTIEPVEQVVREVLDFLAATIDQRCVSWTHYFADRVITTLTSANVDLKKDQEPFLEILDAFLPAYLSACMGDGPEPPKAFDAFINKMRDLARKGGLDFDELVREARAQMNAGEDDEGAAS